jgi:hypothetical protein
MIEVEIKARLLGSKVQLLICKLNLAFGSLAFLFLIGKDRKKTS